MSTIEQGERAAIEDDLLIAEGLRNDRKHKQAVQAFESLHSNGHGLTPVQQRWSLAHHGAALCEAYVPFADAERLLDDAEKKLLKALEVGEPSDLRGRTPEEPVIYAWAWARLGEVYRLKGNLPALDFTSPPARRGGLPPLKLRVSVDHYAIAECCFKEALRQRPAYPWAKAHYGAMLVNRRRFLHWGNVNEWLTLQRGNAGEPASQREQDVCRAKKLIEDALKMHQHQHPWALFYQGCANFLSCLNTLVEMMEAGNAPTEKDTEFLFMTFSIVMSLVQDPPPIYRNPVQPGTVGRDEYLSLTYDVLDFLPRFVQAVLEKKKDARAEDGKANVAFIDLVQKTVDNGRDFLVEDPSVPGSEKVRFDYALAGVAFYKALICVGERLQGRHVNDLITVARRIAEQAGKIHGLQLPISGSSGNKLLIRYLDVMLILLKIGVMLENVIRWTCRTDAEQALETVKCQLKELHRSLPVLQDDALARLDGLVGDPLKWKAPWLLASLWPLDEEKAKTVSELFLPGALAATP